MTLPRARKLTEHYHCRTLVIASATTSADAKYGTRPAPKVTLEVLKKKGRRPPRRPARRESGRKVGRDVESRRGARGAAAAT